MSEYDYTVASDGSGDFRTIQEAFDAAFDLMLARKGAVSLQIKPGTYFENCTFKDSGSDVTLEGETT